MKRKNGRRIALALGWAILGVVSGAGDALAQAATGIVRVSTSGIDQANCGSVASPCRTLQFAVDEFPLPGAGTILVAAGTYTSADPTQVVRITQRRMLIQGGYNSTFAFSAPDLNTVTIDGQNLRKGVTVDCPIASVNPCHLTLVGVKLTRGFAPPDVGTRNAFGGGMDAFESTVLLIDVDVTQNTARGLDASDGLPGDGGGGGLSFRSSTAFLSNVNFDGNTARGGDGSGTAFRGGLGVGGGIFAFDSTLTMNQVWATNNIAQAGDAPAAFGDSGGQRADGLGGFWALIDSSGAASGLEATDNQALGGDAATVGGLGLGGAIFVQIAPSVSFQSILLSDNSAIGGLGGSNLGGGGGLFAEDARVEIHAGTVVDNLAQGADGTPTGGTGAGGGIYMNSVTALPTELHATNLIIARNTAIAGDGTDQGFAFGGGLFVQCPRGPGVCDPMTASNEATLTHVTFADNVVMNATFNQGAALYANQASVVDSFFGIVSGHTTPVTPDDRGEAVLTWGDTTFNDTLWHGNTIKSFTAPGGSFQDNDPQAGDPLYVAPGADPPDYHIQAGSAAIDSANASTTPHDVDHQLRPFVPEAGQPVPDLGADEHYPDTTPQLPEQGLFATDSLTGKLLHLDAGTGVGHPVGAGPVGLVGLASARGRLFGLWGPDQLIRFDPRTGEALSVTTPGIGVGAEGAVAVGSDTVGFAARGDPSAIQLWRFRSSGDSAALLNANLGPVFDGLDFDSSGTLFGLSGGLSLYQMNIGGGAPVLIGATGLASNGMAGLAFADDGTLYAAVADDLSTANPNNAAANLVGAVGGSDLDPVAISGLAYVPEPARGLAEAAAIAALTGLAGWRRRPRLRPRRTGSRGAGAR